jgi:uncharacterized RDD family membrane protein YckC
MRAEVYMKSVLDDIRHTAETKENQIHVIGFGRRFVAMLLDGFIVVFVSYILALLIGMVDVFFGNGVLPWNLIIILVMLLFSVFYFTGKWVQDTGQTPGKLLMKIKIVNTDGSPLTAGKLFVRYFGYIISGLVASLGFIWVALDKKRRGWHDILAGTYVIDLQDDIPMDNQVIFIQSDAGKGWIWVVVWVMLGLGAPAILFSSLWFLGPIMSNLVNGLR